jgi:hypothetical protein
MTQGNSYTYLMEFADRRVARVIIRETQSCLLFLVCLLSGLCCLAPTRMAAAESGKAAAEPRIVNIYNFMRNSDFRLKDSENILFDCTQHQIELLKQYNLPATWALQYDALINPRYQKLLKSELGTNDEISAWWEIPRQLAEKAGIHWRGEYDWDPAANVGFAPGYTPEERRKLVDVYMADFKSAFGYYPPTVGSWFIDEVTLEYMAEKYGVVASCNCKDQIGTDFYTLWGGYWNQAYYPSRVNSYMPAQTSAGQINIPVFRMLGSDPIYQHGTTPGLQSLEPVYSEAGGSPKWVAWFMNNMVSQPSLAFGYTQAGQENSFGWNAMKRGLTNQIAMFAGLAKAGTIRVETLEQSGKWFKKKYPLTPATAVVALDDWKEQGHKTVWYDSRFYRLNVLWDKNGFFIRDIHCFDERIVSPTHENPLRETSLVYETLPIVDWALWSHSGTKHAGMWPVLLGADGSTSPLQPDGTPIVKELNTTDLSIVQPLQGGGTFSIVCAENSASFEGKDGQGHPLNWACQIVGGSRLKTAVTRVDSESVAYSHSNVEYHLKLGSKAGSCRQLEDGSIELVPNAVGKLVLKFDPSSLAVILKDHDSALSKK